MSIFDRRKNRVHLIRTAALGDVLSVEPVIRALKLNYDHVSVEAGIYKDVFLHNPFLSPPIIESSKIIDLNESCEKFLHELREDVYLRLSGVTLMDNLDKTPRLYLTREEKRYAAKILGKGKFAILDISYPMENNGGKLYLQGFYRGERKSWQRAHFRPELWVDVVDTLKDLGYKVVQIGNRGVVGGVPNVDLDVRDKTSLRQLFSLIDASELFVGMESGPMHVARAFAKKGVAIFNKCNPHWALLNGSDKIVPIYRNEGESFPNTLISETLRSFL